MRQAKLFSPDAKKNLRRLLPALLILLGALMRLWKLGQVPGGVHQDEAFAAYEAYCLLENGTDSWGYPFPVYFTAWGSGMNALEIYLMMPLVKLFGLTTWAIRLPQAIVACLTLPAFYGIMRRLFDGRTGLIALSVLAICPWHILLARWGLESNLAPGFLMFGLYFFVRGMERPAFYPLSALFYGLSLYCYATIWVVVPVIIVLEAGYALYAGRMRLDRHMALSAAVLLVLALPLLLYLLINGDILPEIRTPFLSIPRMREARIDEVSLSHAAENLRTMARMLILQSDGELYNAPAGYGLYYFLAAPFILTGAVRCVVRVVRGLRSRRACAEAFVLIQLLPALALGCLISGNIVRLNSIHMPMLMLEALGIAQVTELFGKRRASAGAVILAAYTALFAGFARHYFTDYADRIDIVFRDGLEEAVDRAKALAGEGTIDVLGGIEFPRILFCDETDPRAYMDTVTWKEGAERWLQASSFTRYRFGAQEEPAGVIIADFEADLSAYEAYEREEYGWITVLYK